MAGPTTLFQTGVHASRPAASAGCVLYSCTTHSLVYRSDGSSWTTWMTIPTGASVATDVIWDAAGDLAVGTGADTAAKLAKGPAGANLSSYNGTVAWNGGTSFPASPATGDRYWRSDLGMEAYYDGTRWLCTCPHTENALQDNISASASVSLALDRTYDIWVTTVDLSTFVSTTNDGTKNWTFVFNKLDSSNVATSLGTATTAADTASTWTSHKITVGAAVTTSGYFAMRFNSTKVSTPGNLTAALVVYYRRVLT